MMRQPRARAGFYPYTEASVAGQGKPHAGDLRFSAVTVPLNVRSIDLGAVLDALIAFGDQMLFPKSDDAGFLRGSVIVVCGKSRQVRVAVKRSGNASWRRAPLGYRGRGQGRWA